MSSRTLLRPPRFDDLGLRRALSDRLLPALVGAMTLLAALTLAGVVAASALARHWQEGAAAVLTVQVPQPADGERLDHVLAILRGTPGITSARVVGAAELAGLLRPWLGNVAQESALPLPGVIEVRLAPGESEPAEGLQQRLEQAAPGAFLESHGAWLQRLTGLAHSVQLCAGAALVIVAAIGAAVVALATRAGLAARREAIEIVHNLGATDGFIARRFAARTAGLVAAGSCAGSAASMPVLFALATLTLPFSVQPAQSGWLPDLPGTVWLALLVLPAAAAAIGWATAQFTVRRWLRRLP